MNGSVKKDQHGPSDLRSYFVSLDTFLYYCGFLFSNYMAGPDDLRGSPYQWQFMSLQM